MASAAAGEAMPSGLGGVVPRSKLYQVLQAPYRYPDEELHAELAAGRWLARLETASEALPFAVPPAAGLREPPAKLEDAQVEYSRLFDVGPGGPPCSLFGGHYENDRLRVMEETIRFYDFFGLRFDRDVGIFPDHMAVELEFMAYLAGQPPGSTNGGSFLRAQRDFIERHLCRWVPQLERAVADQAELPFYRALISFTAGFLEADRQYLVSALRQVAE